MNLCSKVGRAAASGLIVGKRRSSRSFLRVQQTPAKVGMCNPAVSRDEMGERWTKRAAGEKREGVGEREREGEGGEESGQNRRKRGEGGERERERARVND